MTRLYATTTVLSLLLTFLCTCVSAQTTIAELNFDGTETGTVLAISDASTFADNGSGEFFGIYDSNDDDTDGTPNDTGNTISTTRPNNVNGAPVSGDFFFIVDANEFYFGGTEATFTVGPANVSGQTDVQFSFFFRAYDFDGGEDVFYEFTVDGVPQGRVQIVDGVSQTGAPIIDAETVTYNVPDNAASVSVALYVDQNSDEDYIAFDNFLVTADNPGLPCGVTAFGPTATEECVDFTNGTADEYTVSFPYVGTDAGGTLALLVDGSPVTTFTNTGDDPTTTADGTITLSSPSLTEGTSYEVTFTDAGGSCSYSVTGSVAANTCVSVCDLTVNPIRFLCDASTAGTDMVSAEIRYFGSEPGVTVTATGGISVGGNDPATDPGGTGVGNVRKILLTGLEEGGTYTVTISGGACSGTEAIVVDATVPADLCQPVGDLVINEFYASPNTGAGEYEFVELYNRGLSVMDLSNYTLEEGAGSTVVIPDGTFVNPGEGLVIAAGTTAPTGCQVINTTFIGLNNDGDVIILRNAAGTIMQQLNYGAEASGNESLALSPDGNLDGGYKLHTTVSNPVENNSPCMDNENASQPLPVRMRSFTAELAGKNVRLNWETEAERNNDFFLVEKFTTARTWVAIGSVPAATGSNNHYVFVDENPVNGDNIYRLRQTDTDGDFTLYGPVSVVFSETGLRVYPNPAGAEIAISGEVGTEDRVSLLSASGRELRRLPAGSRRADLSGLPAGIYLLRVARASGTEVVRFVKK